MTRTLGAAAASDAPRCDDEAGNNTSFGCALAHRLLTPR
jgi:hypothetical protein